ncbi:MAG: hypothetical protein RLZZ200_1780 [Pseudomonadota bacterium]|jgi:acyl-coenzyme A synthetase/AMP-(fatty) acid ligase
MGSVAVWRAGKEFSHAEFRAHISWVKHWLIEQGLDETHPTGIVIVDPYISWVVMLALFELGGVFAVVALEQVGDIRDRLGVRQWIRLDREPPMTERAWALPAKTLLEQRPGEGEVLDALRLDMVATATCWFFTSGTTGTPKTVALDAGRLQARITPYREALSAETRALMLTGRETLGGFMISLVTWLQGGMVIFGGTANGPHAEGALSRCNLISASPAQLLSWLSRFRGQWPGKEGRCIRSGGARLSLKLRNELLARACSQIQTTYGSTELGVVATCDALLLDQYPGAAGHIYPGAEVEVVDKEGMTLPPGQEGLLRCRVPGMAEGYLGETDSATFRGGWFLSGDLGVMHPDGVLEVIGRTGDVFNLGGVKLSALDLDARIQAVPGVADGCAVQLNLKGWPGIGALVVPDKTVPWASLRQQVAAALKGPYAIKAFPLKALRRNAMGKIPRAKLANQLVNALKKSAKSS